MKMCGISLAFVLDILVLSIQAGSLVNDLYMAFLHRRSDHQITYNRINPNW